MLFNHIVMSFRSIVKHKLYSAINIIGLAMGMAISILIILFVSHETSFDKAVPDSERIYRLNWESKSTSARFATFFNPVSPMIADAHTNDVDLNTRIAHTERLLNIGDQKQYQTISFVDPNYFDMFPRNILHGSSDNLLENQNYAVLTEIAANTLFPEQDAVGKTFSLDGQHDFQVTAIIENNKSNSHQIGNIYVHMEMLPIVWNRPELWEQFGSDQLYHFVKLAPNVSPEIYGANASTYITENLDREFGSNVGVYLQPLTDIHFNTELQNEMTVRDTMTGLSKPHRQRTDVSIFGFVALLTITIATFNFVNMQIAQSSNRFKEVGVRKVLGASRYQIATQFIVESSVMALVALIGAMVIVELFAPFFGSMLGIPLVADPVYSFGFMSGLVLVAFLIGCLSGLYPALFISGILPAKAIRGRIFEGFGSAKLRAGLIILQFSIAIGLMSATGIVNNQLDFALNKPLGYEPENIIAIRLNNNEARQAYLTMREQLRSSPFIENASGGSIIPTMDLSDGSAFMKEDAGPEFQLITRRIVASDGYFDTLEMKMLAGRPFSKDFPADVLPEISPENSTVTGGLILNETALRQAGWATPEEAIGEQLYNAFSFGGTDYRINLTIVGVVEDAHYSSVRSEPAPLSYYMMEGGNVMIVKAAEGKIAEATTLVDQIWSQHVSAYPIRRTYLEEDYAAFYAVEGRVFRMFIGFAGIAAMIACIGLYGLASFIADRRTKEIGIRKVLGASVLNIVMMLSWELSKLVIIANIIAWPAAWLLMNDWLMGFSYRIDMSVTPYLIAGLVAFILAYCTTSIRSWAAARINPIYSLKSE